MNEHVLHRDDPAVEPPRVQPEQPGTSETWCANPVEALTADVFEHPEPSASAPAFAVQHDERLDASATLRSSATNGSTRPRLLDASP